MFAGGLFMSFAENIYFDMVMKSGVHVRSALTTAIYNKSLRLSNAVRAIGGWGGAPLHCCRAR